MSRQASVPLVSAGQGSGDWLVLEQRRVDGRAALVFLSQATSVESQRGRTRRLRRAAGRPSTSPLFSYFILG